MHHQYTLHSRKHILEISNSIIMLLTIIQVCYMKLDHRHRFLVPFRRQWVQINDHYCSRSFVKSISNCHFHFITNFTTL